MGDAMKIKKRWTLVRTEVEQEAVRFMPSWCRHLGIGGFREQGWSAYDQRQNGKMVATGKWGDQIYLLDNGTIACTEYPNGYSLAAAIERTSA